MKYIQCVGTVICALLVVIAIQLQGLKPVTSGEIDSLIKAGKIKEMLKLIERTPVVTVEKIKDGSVTIDNEPLRVTIER